MKRLATSLASVNEHGHIRVEPRTQVTNTVERLSWMVESLRVIESIVIFDNSWREPTTKGAFLLIVNPKFDS